MRFTTSTAADIRTSAEQIDRAEANGRTIELWRDTQTFQANVNHRRHYILVDDAFHGSYAWFTPAHEAFAAIIEHWYALEAEQPAPVAEQLVKFNLDTLVESYERRPASNARKQAWYWLAELESVRFDGDALIVPSKEWDKTTYRTTPAHCSCPARGRCWHIEAVIIVRDALAEDARYDALALADEYAAPVVAKPKPKPNAAERAKAFADVQELWA